MIQARDEELGGLCAPDCAGEECQAERDRRELLALVRELQARIDAVLAECVESENHAAEYGDTPSVYTDYIRAALTATEGS